MKAIKISIYENEKWAPIRLILWITPFLEYRLLIIIIISSINYYYYYTYTCFVKPFSCIL